MLFPKALRFDFGVSGLTGMAKQRNARGETDLDAVDAVCEASWVTSH